MIVGRLQVDGEADLPAVHALQAVLTITPRSVRDADQVRLRPALPGQIPGWEELQCWERLRAALVSFSPGPA